MGKRIPSIDFSKHEHRIEIFKCGDNEIRVDHFQVGNSRMEYIQFINTDNILTITGDYGNWVFNRPFVPSADGYVDDPYWIEKLKTASEQRLNELDHDAIQKEIQLLIESGLEDYGYEGDDLQKAKDWFRDLLKESDDYIDYLNKAYRDWERPGFIDDDLIPNYHKVPIWLNIIFDAFEEICHRIKTEEVETKKTKI